MEYEQIKRQEELQMMRGKIEQKKKKEIWKKN